MAGFIRLLFMPFLLCCVGSLPVAAQTITSEMPSTGSRFSAQLDATHFMPAKRDNDPSTSFTLSGNLRLNERNNILLSQGLTKLYYVDPQEDEVQSSDTVVELNHKLFEKGEEPWGTNLAIALDTTLPLSRFSREQHIVTSALKLKAGKEIIPDKVRFNFRTFYRQHFNSYKTIDRDDNGRFLVRYKIGLEAGIDFQLAQKLSFSFSPTWIERGYEQPAYGTQPAEHDYAFNTAFAYMMNDSTSFAIGYSESNRAEQIGSVSVYLFDEETSQYFVEATQTF